MTPRQFAALCRRLDVDQQRHDRRAALIATLIANSVPTKRKTPFKIQDFMPRRTDAPTQTPEQQAAMLRFAAAASRLGQG